MCSRKIRTDEADEAFTSCQLGLDQPSSKSHRSICTSLCDWLWNKSSSNGSWRSCCRTVADAVGPSRPTINESVTFTRRAVRPAGRQAAPASTSGGGAPTRFAALDRRIVQPGSGCYHPLAGRGWKHGRRQTQDEGAEDKLRGVSVRHSCAFKGLDQRSRHTHHDTRGTHAAQEGWAIDASTQGHEVANASSLTPSGTAVAC